MKIRKFRLWLEVCLKRLLRQKGFLALLIALPLLAGFTRYWEENHTTGVEVGILKSQEPLAQAATKELLANDGLFEFVIYPTEASLKEAVETRRLEAGVIFSEDLTEKLKAGQGADVIRLLKSPSSVTQGMVAEVVFAEVLDGHTPAIIEAVVRESKLFPGKEAQVSETIVQDYLGRRKAGGTYQFEYEYLSGKQAEEKGLDLFPLKGLVAIFIMLTAWIMVLSWYRDHDAKIYQAFAGPDRKWAGLISVLLPVALMTLTGFLVLVISGKAGNPIWEAFSLSLYGLAVSLFLYGAKLFFASPVAYGAILPVGLLGSLVASPAILDMSSLIPKLGILEKFFFPTYYLALSPGFRLWPLFGLLAFALVGYLLTRLEDRRFD